MNAPVLQLVSLTEYAAPAIAVTAAYHAAVGRHSHDCYELVYVQGGFCLHDVDDQMALLTEGDVFLMRPGQTHRYLGNHAVSIFNCLFAPDQLPQSLGVLGENRGIAPHIHLSLSERKDTVRLLGDMLEEITARRVHWELKLSALLHCMLVEYARLLEVRAGPDGQSAAFIGFVQPVLQYIDRNFARDLSIRHLAGVAGVSADYLTRQFRQTTGITPSEYLRRYRLARAMELLGRGQRVSDAAERVGFMSLAHFSREFKKELGMTPTGYRRQALHDR